MVTGTAGTGVVRRRAGLAAALAVTVAAGLVAVRPGHHPAPTSPPAAAVQAAADVGARHPSVQPGHPGPPMAAAATSQVPQLPGGGVRVFGHRRFLVAYYGTWGTGSLGVLGENPPDVMQQRLTRAAAPFRLPGEHLQPVYELIVTVADRVPGPAGAYSHDIAADHVREYVDAAHRHGALVVLDLQPGRTDFLTVAKRWAWALRDPWVGLALDPEWRMGPRQVPGHVIGSVSAAEVNATSAWLAGLVRARHLPEKPFLLHEFRTTMIRDIDRVQAREGLAMVQHVDGFGTQRQKLATYHTVARPRQFTMGFKLFYDEDINRFTPARVRQIRPVVRFVSYQ